MKNHSDYMSVHRHGVNMEDFTNLEIKNKSYGGANGNKKSVIFNNKLYMLKTPCQRKIESDVSFSNSSISEYISSFVFSSVGLSCQETILGFYKLNNVKRISVLCRDFETNGFRFCDFLSLSNQVIARKTFGHSTELTDILEIFSSQDLIPYSEIVKFFWETFVVDAFLGNWDRHNGNWGYLYNLETGENKIAPIFDNGSSLFPQADEKIMKLVMSNKSELYRRVYDIPYSAITIDGKKINYFDFLTSTDNKECISAIKTIVPKIDLDKIFTFIDNIEILSDIQKSFYKTILKARKELILDVSFKKYKE